MSALGHIYPSSFALFFIPNLNGKDFITDETCNWLYLIINKRSTYVRYILLSLQLRRYVLDMVVIMVNNKCRNNNNRNVDVRSLNCKSWHSMWINWTMKRSITAAIKHCNGGQQNLESLSAVMFSCDLAISSHCAAAVKLCLERKLILLFLMIERTTLFFVQNSLEYNFVTRYIVKAKTKSAF